MRFGSAAVKAIILNAILRLYPHRSVNGIRIVFTDVELSRDLTCERLSQSLELIKAADALQYRRIVRYVRQIVVWPAHYSVATPPSMIQLSIAHVMESDPLELASVLIHEATHLRIARHGIPDSNDFRERIERRCVKEQVAFLRTRGFTGEAMAKVFDELLETAWWSDEARRKDFERVIADSGMPEWVSALLHKRPGHS